MEVEDDAFSAEEQRLRVVPPVVEGVAADVHERVRRVLPGQVEHVVRDCGRRRQLVALVQQLPEEG